MTQSWRLPRIFLSQNYKNDEIAKKLIKNENLIVSKMTSSPKKLLFVCQNHVRPCSTFQKKKILGRARAHIKKTTFAKFKSVPFLLLKKLQSFGSESKLLIEFHPCVNREKSWPKSEIKIRSLWQTEMENASQIFKSSNEVLWYLRHTFNFGWES